MYSPKIGEDQVPKLYQIAKQREIRMTKLIREIINDFLDKVEEEYKLTQAGSDDEKPGDQR